MTLPRLRSVGLIARREYLVRFRTKSFKIGTVILVIGALAAALLPVLMKVLEGDGGGDKVAIRVETQLSADPVTRFSTILDVPGVTGTGSAFTFSTTDDAAAARTQVDKDELKALVVIGRGTAGDLVFTIVCKDGMGARVPTLLSQAASAITIEDRLSRSSLTPAEQAALFTPAEVRLEKPVDDKPGPKSQEAEIAGGIIGQVLVIFLFMAIILYGQWVATSVAEEKSSRVIEVVINAATPTELLAGKVLGVGALGLTQYVAAVIPALLAFIFQGQITTMILGSGGGSLPDLGGLGLTPAVMLVFGVFFALGFLLYATLYAAAGSLVSRMEDINSVVAPMTLISTAGYIVAVYTSIGLIPADAPWVVALAYVPFTSPYMMVSRATIGAAGPLEVVIAVVILAVSAALLLWFAARVYAAGILMYGQKVGFRSMVMTAIRGRT